MSSEEQYLEFYQEKLESLSAQSAELTSRIEDCKRVCATNEQILRDLRSEKERLQAVIAAKQVNLDEVNQVGSHIERLWMQLHDHLSMERQFLEEVRASHRPAQASTFWETVTAATVTTAIVAISIISAKRCLRAHRIL